MILISLLIGSELKTFVTYDYTHSKECIDTKPKNKNDCHSIEYDVSEDENQRIIACCYVSYTNDDEGDVKKCVPMYKTTNGIHMYREQVKNLGGTSININCSAQKLIISLFIMINILLIL